MDEMREEYDFSAMESLGKGKYVEKYRQGTNIVQLDPDVALVFHDDKAVNDALRSLMDIAAKQVNLK